MCVLQNFKIKMSNLSKICELCKKQGTEIACDSCNKNYHNTCIGLSSTEIKAIQLKNRILSYQCKECKENMMKIPKLISIINELSKQIEELKSAVQEKNDVMQKNEYVNRRYHSRG